LLFALSETQHDFQVGGTSPRQNISIDLDEYRVVGQEAIEAIIADDFLKILQSNTAWFFQQPRYKGW
jgi:hypothetical protein